MASTNVPRSRYVGVGQQEQIGDQVIQQTPTQQQQQQPRQSLPPRFAQALGVIAISLIFIRVLYTLERHLAFTLGLVTLACIVVGWIRRKKTVGTSESRARTSSTNGANQSRTRRNGSYGSRSWTNDAGY
mmetsp:Transcript_19303/g.28560  ORF Transcript_19303/g.28560 Transcript_19303/m.28560 type:complete len:130 (+) Transcript_19303:64-453(+)